ncbi:ribonuclease toxin immunity protein CdiI [Enterococcus sp. LJL128]
MKYTVLTDKKEISQLIYEFFSIFSNEGLQGALKNFTQKKGFGIEYVSFMFNDEIDESFQAYGVLKDSQVLFSVDQPAATEDCEAYLSFEEFYEYIETAINRVIKDGHEKYDEPEISRLLGKVKKALDIR